MTIVRPRLKSEDVVCTKCGGTADYTYHRDGWECPEFRRFVGEHLHMTCSCGYQWSRPPLDAREDKPA